jgi:hypothetical protein
MNASTIVLGGSGMSLPLLDAPKPSGELHVGSTIWKSWASIKYTFISLFSQVEHVRRKTQLEQKFDLGNARFSNWELRALSSRLQGFMTPTCLPMQMFGATWYPTWNQKLRLSRVENFCTGGHILAVGNKISHSNTRVPKFSKFHKQLSGIIMHAFGIQGRSRLDWNILEKFHLRSDAALKNSRTEAH